jgi:hypothetical protein
LKVVRGFGVINYTKITVYKYPNETMVILNKILPEDILNDTSIGLIDILDKIALAKDQGKLAIKIINRLNKLAKRHGIKAQNLG